MSADRKSKCPRCLEPEEDYETTLREDWEIEPPPRFRFTYTAKCPCGFEFKYDSGEQDAR